MVWPKLGASPAGWNGDDRFVQHLGQMPFHLVDDLAGKIGAAVIHGHQYSFMPNAGLCRWRRFAPSRAESWPALPNRTIRIEGVSTSSQAAKAEVIKTPREGGVSMMQ